MRIGGNRDCPLCREGAGIHGCISRPVREEFLPVDAARLTPAQEAEPRMKLQAAVNNIYINIRNDSDSLPPHIMAYKLQLIRDMLSLIQTVEKQVPQDEGVK